MPANIHSIIQRLDPSDDEGCGQLLLIYRQAIPASERKPDAMILAMLRRTDYAFFVARQADRIIGFAIFFISACVRADDRSLLLEYMATEEAYRGMGVGGALFRESIDLLKKSSGPAPILIEVESDQIASPQQLICRKRIEFYRRLGCRRIIGLNYILPLDWPVPAMELMIRTADDSIPTITLRRWLQTIYSKVYGRDANDPRIDQMLAGAADHFALE